MLFHTPVPSATRLVSLWRHLAVETRGVDELTPPPSTAPTMPHNHHPRHKSTTPPRHGSTHIRARPNTVPCSRSTSPQCPYAQSPCRHAGAYLDTVPVSPYLRLSDADFICDGSCNSRNSPNRGRWCNTHLQFSSVLGALTL